MTGRRSNQLNYDPEAYSIVRRAVAARRPTAPGTWRGLVGGTGLEPVTAGV